jgi:hypothetical protein
MRSALVCGALMGLVACGGGGESEPDDGAKDDASVEADASVGDDAGSIPPCIGGKVNLRVGGQDRTVSVGSAVNDSWTAGKQLSKGWAFGTELDQHGYAVIRGPDSLDRSAVDGPRSAFMDGETLKVGSSYWLFDASASGTGVITCTGGGASTVQRKGNELLLDLKGAGTIPACPGTPVAGAITTCISSGCPADHGSIAGTPWTAQGNSRFILEGRGSYSFSDVSFVLFDANGAKSGSVANWGLLFTSGASPFAGKVFCVGKVELNSDGSERFSELSELPACPSSAPGSLRGCSR